MSKHTPGPWTANLETYPIMVSSQSETWPLVDELGNEEGRTGAFVCNTGDNKANARLIASAPDLLGALELLVAGIENSVSDTYLPLAKARAAIAKAKGGQA